MVLREEAKMWDFGFVVLVVSIERGDGRESGAETGQKQHIGERGQKYSLAGAHLTRLLSRDWSLERSSCS